MSSTTSIPNQDTKPDLATDPDSHLELTETAQPALNSLFKFLIGLSLGILILIIP
jgi:hypothetical protein